MMVDRRVRRLDLDLKYVQYGRVIIIKIDSKKFSKN